VNPEPTSKVASIDMGTNTFLLLVAEVKGDALRPLLHRETIVRLGHDIQKTGALAPEAMERGVRTLIQYLRDCRAMEVQKIYAVGTSALRQARNAQEFLKRVNKELDVSVEVISGEEEARMSYLAVARDLGEEEQSLSVVDVGGGSTEVVVGHGGHVDEWVSLPIGAVCLTEQFLLSNPVRESEWNVMMRAVEEALQRIPSWAKPGPVVAVGGTATTLASVELGLAEFVPEKIHHFVLWKKALKDQVALYRCKSIEERKKIPGLPSSRADVILAGAVILQKTMEKLGSPSVLISCHGVRYGVLYDRLNLPKRASSERE
jgi:exopolyphosphatase/guanosine-5'-triphosphate,3'-diphosphate pyrophosphatase